VHEKLIQSIDALTNSRSEVNSMVVDLSTNVMDAWVACQKQTTPPPPRSLPRPTTPASIPLQTSPRKKHTTTTVSTTKKTFAFPLSAPSAPSTPSTPTLGLKDVREVVDVALKDLVSALQDRATKTMVSVVQEQSLAQIDVLRNEMYSIDQISRKGDLLQLSLQEQAKDLSKVYDHLMDIAKNGGETNQVVAELRLRIDETTEKVAHIVNDQMHVDQWQSKLLKRTTKISNTTKLTDKRLSFMMGSFMDRVENEMKHAKRQHGEAAHELKNRFSKELRHSMNRVSTKLSALGKDLQMMHPLVNTVDVSNIGSTSLVLASRCVSCDRPIVGTNCNVGDTHNRKKNDEKHAAPRHSLKGALQGSLLLTPGRGGKGKGGGIPSSAPQYRSSETRGGGFRVGGLGLSPGQGLLWVGGHGSPTGVVRSPVRSPSRRPASSMGLREKRY
jgi:hypothetical protein|tara:strand:- start:79 stop:1407 length:1329 start_codon:yes stop_codon:yes gene_type:complete